MFFNLNKLSKYILICSGSIFLASSLASSSAYSMNYISKNIAAHNTDISSAVSDSNMPVVTHGFKQFPIGTKLKVLPGATSQEVDGMIVYLYHGSFFVKSAGKSGYVSINAPKGVYVKSIPQNYHKLFVKNKLVYRSGNIYYKFDQQKHKYLVIPDPTNPYIASEALPKAGASSSSIIKNPAIKKQDIKKTAIKKPAIKTPELNIKLKPKVANNKATSKLVHKKVNEHPARVIHHPAPIVKAPGIVFPVAKKVDDSKVQVKEADKAKADKAKADKAKANAKIKAQSKSQISPKSHLKPHLKPHLKSHPASHISSIKPGDVLHKLPNDARVKVINGVQFQESKGVLYLPTVAANNQIVYVVVKVVVKA